MTNGNVIVDIQNREIIIENLTIKNPDVYDFLQDKQNVSDWTERALIVGCSGLKQMVVTDRVDYIEKEFGKFSEQTTKLFEKFDLKNTDSPLYQIKEILGRYFDNENGQLKKMLEKYFDKDQGEIRQIIDQNFDINNRNSAFSILVKEIKENSDLEEDTIKGLLDPNKTDSPIRQLKEDLAKQVKDLQDKDLKEISLKIKDLREHEIKDIRDILIGKEAQEEEYLRSTQKGRDFEDEIYLQMEGLAKPYKDDVKHVGAKTGKTGKIGDILVDIDGDPKKRIVIECKYQRVGLPGIKEEIIEALTNRNAKFCIYIFSNEGLMPSEYCPLKINNNSIITCRDKQNLHMSYRLAREIIDATKEGESVKDQRKILVLLNEIESQIRNIDQMEKEATTVIKTGQSLKNNLEKMQAAVDIRIEKIKAHLDLP